MMNPINEFVKRVLTAAILFPFFLGAYLHSPLLFTLLLSAVLIITLVFEWPKLIDTSNKKRFFLISFFYPTMPIIGLILLDIWYRYTDIWLPMYPFLVAWTADTFGYMVGKMWGKHKMCPTISPGKSWEGLLGSFVGVSIANFFVFSRIDADPFLELSDDIGWILAISLIITIVAFLGGLFISFFKRRRELKDAGALLPGHGGILDRFDSVFFVIIFVWGMLLFANRDALTSANLKTIPTTIIHNLFERDWKK
ncbi:MAG: phosphatidate cytidylyltransferase [bacterium]